MKTLRLLALALAASPAWAHHPAGSTSSGGGQMTLSPETLESGKLYLALRIDGADYRNISDRRLHEAADSHHSRHAIDWEETVAAEGAFGITNRLSVGLTVPYRRIDDFREAHHRHGDEEEESETLHGVDPDGLGDIQLWGQFGLLEGPFRIGLRFGVEVPTGDTNDRSADGEVLEPSHQAGSGSWDFFGGIAAGYSAERWAIQAALLGRVNTRGIREYEIGDSVTLSAGGSFRFFGEAKTPALSVTVDAWGEWHGRDRDHGRGIPDSGGFQWYVAPGLRFSAAPVFIQVAFPIQLYNGVNEEPEQRFRAVLTAGLAF